MLIQNFVLCLIFVLCEANVSPTEDYPHQANLDATGKMILFWKFNETHVTFELHGNTTGWIGMGISPNGAMTGADVVVGWVKDGVAMVTDRHGVGNTFPPLDPEHNVELLDGMESDGWTMIKFRRQLASCESGYDLPITTDTLKIIQAFGHSDPQGNDISGADYHNSNRGSRSLILLDVSGGEQSNFPDGEVETHLIFDLLNDNFEIPEETTYYNCRLHKIPEFNEKQHVVKIEPVIQAGNELMVHHILVYQCIGSTNETESLGTNTRCYGSDMPPDFQSCSFVIVSWAIGGTAIYYPTHTGYPLGEADSPKYVVLETHYDNPRGVKGVRDSSGLRFTYTSKLRQYDAGIMQVGHAVTGTQHIIPPNDESFLTFGECTSQCMRQALLQDEVESINIFGTLLHSHLLGTGLTVRHIRNTTELPYLSKDDAYDFNYQETRRLPEERVIRAGDSLQVVCNYKTQGVREDVSVGGLETEKEMCLAFIYYYPKISITFCETAPEYTALINHFGVLAAQSAIPNFGIYNDIYDMEIVAPETLQGQNLGRYLNAMTWDETTNQRLEDDLRSIARIQNCRGIQGVPEGVDYHASTPVVDFPYEEEEQVCLRTDESTSTKGGPITSSPSTDIVPDTEESGGPPQETTTELNGDAELTTDDAVQSSSSVLTYLLAFVLSVMFLRS